MFRRGVVLAVLVLLACVPPATASQVSGKLTGAKLPKPGQGFTSLRAVSLKDWSVAAAVRVPRSGRYRMRVPAGNYALVSSLARRGAPAPKVASAPVRLKPGKQVKRKLRVIRRPRKPRRARAAGVTPGGYAYRGTAVAIDRYTGAGGDLAVLNKGLADLLIAGMAGEPAWDPGSPPGGCELTLVEWERRKDILEEIERSNDPRFDPETRMDTSKLIDPEVFVTGAITAGPGDTIQISTRIVDARTGAVRATVQSATSVQGVFDAADAIARQITAALCKEEEPPSPPVPAPPPASRPALAGTFGATASLVGIQYAWSGSSAYVRDALAPGLAGNYTLESGQVGINAQGTYDGCTASTGSANFALTPAGSPGLAGVSPANLQAPFAPPYTYTITQPFPYPGTMSLTLGGCPEAENNGTIVPVGLPSALDTVVAQTSADGRTFAGTSGYDGGAQATIAYTWSFALR